MVRIAAGEYLHVQANASVKRDGFHDVTNQRASEVATDHAEFVAFGLATAHAVRAAGDIDHGFGQGLVQRHGGIGKTANALLVSQRLLQGLTEHDGGVFHSVVHIDIGIAMRMDG